MKKVLILTYFFPPCNLTASQRILGWVKYLHKYGYYPIVVTRNWDVPIKEQKDISQSSGEVPVNIKHETYEVHYLPYKGNLRDKLYSKYGNNRFVLFRKLLSLIEIVFQNFTIKVIPFKNIYYFSKEFLKKNRDIHNIIISANPFQMFFFGYLLQKNCNIEWIADYRDDWSTDELKKNKSFLDKIIFQIEKRSEKKWVGTASYITSVSDYYVNKISIFTKIKGQVVYNGFFPEDFDLYHLSSLFEVFTLTYNGTLYPSQHIETFIEGFKQVIRENDPELFKIRLFFSGLGYDKHQEMRVRNLLKGYEDHYIITNRIPKNKVLDIQKKSHILLMFPHNGIKGIPSSKLYEYLGLNKLIMLCPSDNDIIEQTLKETGIGIICNSANEVADYIKQISKDFSAFYSNLNFNNNLKYSREEQTKNLVKILDLL
jgi:glycosyltransferase involved in cell wall biosynthesis